MRKSMVIGNWKMHGLVKQAALLAATICDGAQYNFGVEVVLLPAFVHLPLVRDILCGSNLFWGGQNLYFGHNSAITGEISADMLVDLGCKYVLLGHSERRVLLHEDHMLIARKLLAAVNKNLKPILCVGESLADQQRGVSAEAITEQLTAIISFTGIAVFEQVVLAYEPLWAIGTGATATPEHAQATHAHIRAIIATYSIDIAEKICIIYGGSVKAANALSLFAMPDIDGGLIGGASLNAQEFLTICRYAHETCS